MIELPGLMILEVGVTLGRGIPASVDTIWSNRFRDDVGATCMIEKFPLTSRSSLGTILILLRIPERMKSIPILWGHPSRTEILDTEVVSNWIVTNLYSPILPICIFTGVP